MDIEIKLLHKDIHVPVYATDGSAGLDLRAAITEPLMVMPQRAPVMVPTGIAINIKNPEVAAVILPRSGLGHKKGLVLGNTVGLIDSDYQGELLLSVFNRADQYFDIMPFERIAQLVIVPVIKAAFRVVKEFSAATERGAGGFGSTGGADPHSDLMKFDPVVGILLSHRISVPHWRDTHDSHVWLYNPWSGSLRHDLDVESDPFGHLIVADLSHMKSCIF